MSLVEKYNQIQEVREKLTKWVQLTQERFSNEDVVYECMALRGYKTEVMFDYLNKIQLFKFNTLSNTLIDFELTNEELEQLGLLRKGKCLLEGMYCVPIKTIDNKVMAIVGYYPDKRKYITSPTFGFSKATSFFGEEHIEYIDKPYVCICEGIFDTISLQAHGFPALGNQGLDMSVFKSEKLRRYKRIVAIPDSDTAGRKVNPYYTKGIYEQRNWQIPIDNVFVNFANGIKDVDDYLKQDGVDLEAMHNKFLTSKYIITL